MHPIERLRWIARAEDEPAASLASEAAYTLGDLAYYEPNALLTACRRLLSSHAECGPLWWVAAQVMAASDPHEAARHAAAELCSDQTPARVAEALRASVAGGEGVVVTTPFELCLQALVLSRVYALRFVAQPWLLRRAIRAFDGSASELAGYPSGEEDEAVAGASVLLVEALASGPSACLVDPVAGEALEAAARAGVPAWLIVGTGRALPPWLFEEARERTEADDPDGRAAVFTLDTFALAIGPEGQGDPVAVGGAVTCPPGRELLRRAI
jgi:hypothetical protein